MRCWQGNLKNSCPQSLPSPRQGLTSEPGCARAQRLLSADTALQRHQGLPVVPATGHTPKRPPAGRTIATSTVDWQASPIGIGRVPPSGFSRPTSSPSCRNASRGGVPDSISPASHLWLHIYGCVRSIDAWQAAQIISIVQPDGLADVHLHLQHIWCVETCAASTALAATTGST